MGEYEPEDSRDVTRSTHTAPGEPPRTGPREGETRQPQNSEPHQQGVADPEPADKPTARDALGKKQPGFASDRQEQAEDSDEEPPLAK
jgi:hypothetical protein